MERIRLSCCVVEIEAVLTRKIWIGDLGDIKNCLRRRSHIGYAHEAWQRRRWHNIGDCTARWTLLKADWHHLEARIADRVSVGLLLTSGLHFVDTTLNSDGEWVADFLDGIIVEIFGYEELYLVGADFLEALRRDLESRTAILFYIHDLNEG